MRRDQTKRAWKVVYLDHDQAKSVTVHEPAAVVGYELGKWSLPKIGKLFVFNQARAAWQFYCDLAVGTSLRPFYAIYEGRAMNLAPAPKRILGLGSPEEEGSYAELISKFWNEGPSAVETFPFVFPGTAICDRFLSLADVTEKLRWKYPIVSL